MVDARRWCFTLNNYTEEELKSLENLQDNPKIRYFVAGKEIGADNQTPHIQGYVEFIRSFRFKKVKEMLSPRIHLELAKGSKLQNITYCTKEGIWLEFGSNIDADEVRKVNFKTQVDEAIETIRETNSLTTLISTNPSLFLKFSNGFKHIQSIIGHSLQRNHLTKVYWLHGQTGTGKTRGAFERFPFAYFKDSSKWWNGYGAEEEVIIDDFRSRDHQFSFLLQLFDRYPLKVEYKGGVCEFVSKVIVVTTPFDIIKTFESTNDLEDIGQIQRRVYKEILIL